MRPGLIPTAARSSGVSLAWVVLAGWEAMLRVSPKLAVSESNLRLSRNFWPAGRPPFNSKQTMPPPFSICFFAIAFWGWLGRKG